MADALARQREQFMREQFAALAAKKELDEARRREKAAKREAEERARLKAQAAPAMVRPCCLTTARTLLRVAAGLGFVSRFGAAAALCVPRAQP